MADSIQLQSDRVEMVRDQLRKKTTIWISFLLFGWSYGSLGKLGLQILWYLIPVFSALGIYQKLVLGDFTIYSAFAIMGIPAWVIWATIRAFTLNRAINSYNSRIADFFGLDKDEKFMLDLD